MSKTTKGLVDFVKTKLGVEYVYGAKGEILTLSKYNYLKQRYSTMVWNSDKNKVGKMCVDCSGLISWYTGTVANSATYKSTATKVLTIDKIAEAVPGCAVWRSGHIGVYIGNGEIIEARGSAYGVVKTKVKDRDFTHILWLKDIDYTEVVETPTAVKENYTIKLNTGTWNVRSLPSASSKVVKIVNGGGTYTASKLQNGWYYVPTVDGWFGPACIKETTAKKTTTTTANVANYYKAVDYKGTSLVDALKKIGVDSSFSNRKKIAKANGISTYLGLASQNSKLLNLLKKGKLKRV